MFHFFFRKSHAMSFPFDEVHILRTLLSTIKSCTRKASVKTDNSLYRVCNPALYYLSMLSEPTMKTFQSI